MKEQKPVGINEQIAVHLGFKKYRYGKNWDGKPQYQWHYPDTWRQPSIPCLHIPDFMGMIDKVKQFTPLLVSDGAPIFK